MSNANFMDGPDLQSPPAQPARVLGPIDATCIVVGAIVGVGIFFSPNKVAALCQTTQLTLIAWAIGGAIALCGALVFAELGRKYHGSGAQYEILRDSYGPLVGFVFVFCNATAIIAGSMGIIAMVCAQYLLAVVGHEEPSSFAVLTIACGLVIGLALANIIGVRWGSRIQNVTVYARLFTLAAIIGIALLFDAQAPPATELVATDVPRVNVVKAILSALVATLFAYGGWQQSLWIAGEIKNPARNVPRAIIGGVVVVVALYLLVNWAYLHLLGPAAVARSEALAADAVGAAVPKLGGRIVAAAVALSAFGVLNVQLLTGPRLIFGLARDRRFFRPFGTLNSTFGTPLPAILLMSVFGIVLILAAGHKDAQGNTGIDRLLTGVVFIDGIFFAMTGAAMVILRINGRSAVNHSATMTVARPYAMRRLMHIALPVFVLGEIGVVIGAYLDEKVRNAAYIGAAWIVMAIIMYFACFRRIADAHRV